MQCCYVNYLVHNVKPSNGGTQRDWQLQGAARHLAQTPARCCTPPSRHLQGAARHLAQPAARCCTPPSTASCKVLAQTAARCCMTPGQNTCRRTNCSCVTLDSDTVIGTRRNWRVEHQPRSAYEKDRNIWRAFHHPTERLDSHANHAEHCCHVHLHVTLTTHITP